jgi:phosphoketolase
VTTAAEHQVGQRNDADVAQPDAWWRATTTPFDLTVRNRVSRYHLVMDAINNARRLPPGATELKARLAEHDAYVVANVEDMPDVRDWSLS